MTFKPSQTTSTTTTEQGADPMHFPEGDERPAIHSWNDSETGLLRRRIEPAYAKHRLDAAITRVRKAYSKKALARICALEPEEFSGYAEKTACRGYPGEDFYYHKDNGSPILGVCHLDSVQSARWCQQADVKGYGRVVFSPVLDDRLGAYILLEWLPALGVHLDLLLCTAEETGRSTASQFRTEKKYNWMVEFDRTGTDVVFYDYECPEIERLFASYGWKVGIGSFSDISYLERLGCRGANIGISYRDYHSTKAHAFLDELFVTLGKFLLLWEDHAGTAMPFEMPTWRTGGRPFWQGGSGSGSGGYVEGRPTTSQWQQDYQDMIDGRYDLGGSYADPTGAADAGAFGGAVARRAAERAGQMPLLDAFAESVAAEVGEALWETDCGMPPVHLPEQDWSRFDIYDEDYLSLYDMGFPDQGTESEQDLWLLVHDDGNLIVIENAYSQNRYGFDWAEQAWKGEKEWN